MNLMMTDILFAAVVSLLITWIIKSIVAIGRLITNPGAIEIAKCGKEINILLQKCYSLFPKDIIQFKGKTFKRGMKIKIITSKHKIIEGKLIGMNNQNILCIMNQRYIIAHEINYIEDIINIEEANV